MSLVRVGRLNVDIGIFCYFGCLLVIIVVLILGLELYFLNGIDWVMIWNKRIVYEYIFIWDVYFFLFVYFSILGVWLLYDLVNEMRLVEVVKFVVLKLISLMWRLVCLFND